MADSILPDNPLPDNRMLGRLHRAIRAKAMPTWVYIIGPVGGLPPVKIGVAFDTQQRLRDLQIGSPVSLEIHYATELGPIAGRFETAVHRALQADRAHGEWFVVTPSDARALVKKMAQRVDLFARLRTARAVKRHLENTSGNVRTTWELERERRRRGNMERKLQRQLGLAQAIEVVDA